MYESLHNLDRLAVLDSDDEELMELSLSGLSEGNLLVCANDNLRFLVVLSGINVI